MLRLFRLPQCCGAVIVFSMVGGFPVGAADSFVVVEKIKVSSGVLTAEGRTPGEGWGVHSFLEGAEFRVREKDGSFRLSVDLQDAEGMKVADADALGLGESCFSGVNRYESGYVVVAARDGICYNEANTLVKCLLEKLLG